MLGLVGLGLASFLIIPKRPKDYLFFGLALLVCLSLAGENVRQRFMLTFAAQNNAMVRRRAASNSGRPVST